MNQLNQQPEFWAFLGWLLGCIAVLTAVLGPIMAFFISALICFSVSFTICYFNQGN